MDELGDDQMRRVVRPVFLFAGMAAAALLLTAHAADAQNSLGIGRPEQAIQPEGPFAALLFWIQQQQQAFYKAMTNELKGMRESASHIWMLAGLSFAYGVFHAAGPGHGKAVISSYMLANEVAAKRGIVLAFASAFIQAVTAIAVIGAVFLFLRGTSIKQGDATRWLEIASYAGVTALGAWLLWKKFFAGLFRAAAEPAPALAVAGHGGHVHSHAHENRGHRHDHHDHDGHRHHGHDGHAGHHRHADHVHDENCGCGHAHAPDPSALTDKEFGLRQAWSAVLAVGLRPCSGALIVLTFAFLNGLYAAGIASAFAMALGTGITVATLAAMAVWAKDYAVRAGGGSAGAAIHRTIEVAGAAFVFLLGLTLLSAALYV